MGGALKKSKNAIELTRLAKEMKQEKLIFIHPPNPFQKGSEPKILAFAGIYADLTDKLGKEPTKEQLDKELLEQIQQKKKQGYAPLKLVDKKEVTAHVDAVATSLEEGTYKDGTPAQNKWMVEQYKKMNTKENFKGFLFHYFSLAGTGKVGKQTLVSLAQEAITANDSGSLVSRLHGALEHTRFWKVSGNPKKPWTRNLILANMNAQGFKLYIEKKKPKPKQIPVVIKKPIVAETTPEEKKIEIERVEEPLTEERPLFLGKTPVLHVNKELNELIRVVLQNRGDEQYNTAWDAVGRSNPSDKQLMEVRGYIKRLAEFCNPASTSKILKDEKNYSSEFGKLLAAVKVFRVDSATEDSPIVIARRRLKNAEQKALEA